MITIDHSKKGNYRKVTCECVVNVSYLCKNELCELTTNYLLGLQKPHYPVPAIRKHFEFNDCLPVLFYVFRGPLA
jgi:hypothetical protein